MIATQRRSCTTDSSIKDLPCPPSMIHRPHLVDRTTSTSARDTPSQSFSHPLTNDLRCLLLAVLLIGRGDTDFARQLSMQPAIDIEAVQAHLSVIFDIRNTELYNLLDQPNCRLTTWTCQLYYTGYNPKLYSESRARVSFYSSVVSRSSSIFCSPHH